MRCNRHGLAAGPDGECVVCLREARDLATRRARRLALGACVSLFGISGALLAARLLREPIAAQAVTSLAAEPPIAAAPVATQAASETPPSEVATLNAAPSAAPSLPPPAAASAEAVAVASAQPVTPPRQPTSAEVQAAYHATPVLMFSTSWCPVCARARQFFHANGLKFEDRDVDADPQASAELKRRSGGKAIPLIDIDGQQLRPGFSEQATMQAVAASVERRLGVSGIRLVPATVPN
ncbi:MAG TPA: glutaredoxin family protein [Polyangiaceae bacterium]|jgi:glutaredoxin 3|nr:glutaredoxin family protein [Polyangiaceae bacterium]